MGTTSSVSVVRAGSRAVVIRRAARTVLKLAGSVRGIDGRLNIPCLVTDMSATGARVAIVRSQYRIRMATDMPDEVVLFLTSDRLEVCGVIRWRDGEAFGLRFTSPLRRIQAAVK